MRKILLEDEIVGRAEEVKGYVNDTKLIYEFDNKEELDKIIVELKEILRANKDYMGVSAPQIGYNQRVFCMAFKDSYRTFINPSIKDMDLPVLSRETSLSCPGKEYLRFRYNSIKIDYTDPQQKLQSIDLIGKAACIFQQLTDYLDGLALDVIGLEIDKDFDNLSDDEKDGVVANYIQELKTLREEVNKEIESDEELSKMKGAIDFMSDLRQGKLLVSQDELTDDEKAKLKERLDQSKEDNG